MSKFFKNITKIRYEGPDSKNPLSFRTKTSQNPLKQRVFYWHYRRQASKLSLPHSSQKREKRCRRKSAQS